MNPIEFASPEESNIETLSPWKQPAGNPFEDLVLKPEYAARRLRFPVGQTWFRIVPKLKSSQHGWMLPLHELQFGRGRFAHPRTLNRNAKCVFDQAYAWAKEHIPTALYSKANKDGLRLLADPLSLFWVLVEQEGKTVARLIQHSGYDGSRGGAPGLGHKIWQLCHDRDETGARTDVTSAEGGVLVCVEKNQPTGAKYPSYHLTLGRKPKPIADLLKNMEPSEQAALCPLENVVRELTEEEQWQCLGKLVAPDIFKQIRDSLALSGTN